MTNILQQLLDELNSGRLRVVDLTSPLEPATPVIDLPPIFAPSPGLSLTEISRYDSRGPAWYWNVINMGEHTGTHFDAPIHWVTGCVIDVSSDVQQSPDFLLTIERVELWESEHGRLPAGAWLLVRTGWSLRRGREAFLNIQEDGTHSPGFHPTCSAFLAKEREILGVGVETVGTDAGQAGGFDPPFPSHTFMHGAGKFGITSLMNLELLPATGAIVIAAPLKIVNGSGSPLRVIAITP